MKFTYRAYDKVGKQTAGSLDAANTNEATENLRRQGLFVTNIAQADPNDVIVGGARVKRVRTGLRLKHLANFTRQLHVLVSGGTPLVQAMLTIERQCEAPAWKQILQELRATVERGGSLSQAMHARPEWFDSISTSLVSAGEVSGAMGPMLEKMSALIRKQLHLRSSIVGALVYPSLLICVSIVVLISMLLFVLPRFAGLFKTLGSPLPPTTQALFWLSNMLQSYWWAMLPPIIITAVSLRFWARTPGGRHTIQTQLLRLPRIGKISKSLIAARLARLFGTLLESQVPLLDALDLTKQSASNVHYAKLFAHAEEVVSRGEPTSVAFASTDLVSPSIVEAIRTGEQSGRIGAPLLQVADFLDEENEILVKTLTSILEPLILVFLGIVIGAVALSMFLPLFDLAASANGGG